MSRTDRRVALAFGWSAAVAAAAGIRIWNALGGPQMWGYDAWGHVAYVLFLDAYRGVPWADQGWSYFHPPLHYALASPLARFGSGEVLARGLMLLSSAASLGTAALAALVARFVAPGVPGMPLLAFCAVAFLPVHFHLSAMPTNELTFTLLSAAALAVFVGNESRRRPTLTGDALSGLLVGLSFLAKFSGLIPLTALVASLAARALLADERGPALGRAALRIAVLAGVALLVCGPYYARNVRTFGQPFQKSSDFPAVRDVESAQPPGERTLRDYVQLSPRLFVDPDPRAPHMLRSILGSMYASIWADIHRESDTVLTPAQKRRERRPMAWMVVLGVVPTLLALAGCALALRDVVRGRRQALWIPLLMSSGAALGAFLVYAGVQPTWPAVRASYLLTLSLPYAAFLVRAVQFLGATGRRGLAVAAVASLTTVAFAAAAVETVGVVLPRRHDAPATGALHFYFGEYEASRRVYGRLAAGAGYPVPWLDNLGAVELASGRAEHARDLYARAIRLARRTGRGDPYRLGRRAVATALAGDLDAAQSLLDEAIAEASHPELIANRGAVRAARGDVAGALADLRAALDANPEMVPAWRNLAGVLARTDRPGDAAAAERRAASEACRSPRGYPYAIGSGEVVEWGVGRRWLLLVDGKALRVALPAWYAEACGSVAPL